MKKSWTLLILLLFLSFDSSHATTPGGQAGAFLRMGMGARAIGMGNAFTGLARDGFAGYYNPASLPFMTQPELAFSFGKLSLDRSLNFIGISTYLQPRNLRSESSPQPDSHRWRAGFALGWINAGIDNIDARDSDGNPMGMYSNSENAFYFSFALRPLPYLAAGLSAKVLNNRLPRILDDNKTLSATGFGLDFGIYAMPMPRLSLGVVLRDVNSQYTWNTEKLWEHGSNRTNYFPRILRCGAAYQLPANAVIAADAEFNQEQGWRFYAGGEIPFHDLLIARLGYNANRVTFGFGLRFHLWHTIGELNYAYDTNEVTPSADQYFSWRIILDRPRETNHTD